MNINYIADHLNASLITECKEHIMNCLRSQNFSSSCPFSVTILMIQNISHEFNLEIQLFYDRYVCIN